MSTSLVSNQISLINGQFNDEEAKEILTSMLTTKIKFNELKNFSTQIRTGKEDEFAKNRILVLNEELIKIQEIINEAKMLNKKLTIKSDISISIE